VDESEVEVRGILESWGERDYVCFTVPKDFANRIIARVSSRQYFSGKFSSRTLTETMNHPAFGLAGHTLGEDHFQNPI